MNIDERDDEIIYSGVSSEPERSGDDTTSIVTEIGQVKK